MEDKLDLTFQLYDINGDEKLSNNEMLAIVEAIYKMICLYFPFRIKHGHVARTTPRSRGLYVADMNIPGWIHGQAPCRGRHA